MGMSDYDRFMEFLKHIKIPYEIKIKTDPENIWQEVIFTDKFHNKIEFTFDTFGKLLYLDGEAGETCLEFDIIYDVPKELDVDSAKWNTLKNLQPPIDDD